MRKIVIALLLLCALGCGHRMPETPKEVQDGWILVGQKSNCRLYYKLMQGSIVYWSICENVNGITSSVSIR